MEKICILEKDFFDFTLDIGLDYNDRKKGEFFNIFP